MHCGFIINYLWILKHFRTQVRDGAHGFSTNLGHFCGHNFPDIITSKDRFLWLHFHSDENIEYEGFKAVYEFIPRPTSGNWFSIFSQWHQRWRYLIMVVSWLIIFFAAVYDDTECGETLVDNFEGWVNSTMISKEKIDYVTKHNLQLDCMWTIQVEENWKVCSWIN